MNATLERWSTRRAFILAVTGAAVGLGNIWRFPSITGENGGAAFLDKWRPRRRHCARLSPTLLYRNPPIVRQ